MHQKTFWDQNKLLEIFWSSNFFARKLEIWHKIGNLIHKTFSAFSKSSALPRAMGYCPGFIWSLYHLDLGRTIHWQLINQLRPGFCPCGYFTDIHLFIYSYRVFIWRFPIILENQVCHSVPTFHRLLLSYVTDLKHDVPFPILRLKFSKGPRSWFHIYVAKAHLNRKSLYIRVVSDMLADTSRGYIIVYAAVIAHP